MVAWLAPDAGGVGTEDAATWVVVLPATRLVPWSQGDRRSSWAASTASRSALSPAPSGVAAVTVALSVSI